MRQPRSRLPCLANGLGLLPWAPLTPPHARCPPGEVTAVRISGRFCWVEFADVRAAHAALECVPSHTVTRAFWRADARRAARASRRVARPLRADQPWCAQAGRHGHRRAPPACVAEQVGHPQQRPEEAGACLPRVLLRAARLARTLAAARRLRAPVAPRLGCTCARADCVAPRCTRRWTACPAWTAAWAMRAP